MSLGPMLTQISYPSLSPDLRLNPDLYLSLSFQLSPDPKLSLMSD